MSPLLRWYKTVNRKNIFNFTRLPAPMPQAAAGRDCNFYFFILHFKFFI